MENMNAELVKKFPVLKFFKYAHLPPVLQEFSKPFADLAEDMAAKLASTAHPAEVATGLRKLLEAKDCFVRSRLPEDGTPIPPPMSTVPHCPDHPHEKLPCTQCGRCICGRTEKE